MFTRNQIEEIKQKLLLEGIKDSQLPIANTIDGNEMLPILQKGSNKRVFLQTFMNKIAQWTIQDIINISKNNEVYSLQEAVKSVGSINHKIGQMITFIERESNEWRMYQFHGQSTNDWYNLEYWKNQEETISDLQDQLSKVITWNEETDEKVAENANKIEDLNTLIGNNKNTIDNYTINGYKVSSNPKLTKVDVGLSNVDNTADKDKPISTATSTALAKKADLSSGKLLGTQVPVDEEDVTVTDGKIKFKDRGTTNGMGYKVLRRPSNGILTQSMINQSNTIYEIRYNFDLNGATINIPENCILKFEGGKFSNGTIKGNNSTISANLCKIFDTNIKLIEYWKVGEAYPEWFGAQPNISNFDNAPSINACINNTPFTNVLLQAGQTYNIQNTILIKGQNFSFGSTSNNSLYNDFKKTGGAWIKTSKDITALQVVGNAYSLNLHGLCIYSTWENRFKGVGIKFEENSSINSCTFEKIKIAYFNVGFRAIFKDGYKGISLCNFQECSFLGCLVGMYLHYYDYTLQNQKWWMNLNSFNNCHWSFNAYGGLNIQGVHSFEQNLFTSCGFEANGSNLNQEGWDNYEENTQKNIYGLSLSSNSGQGITTFDNCYFEINLAKGINNKQTILETNELQDRIQGWQSDILIQGAQISLRNCAFNYGMSPIIHLGDTPLRITIDNCDFKEGNSYKSNNILLIRNANLAQNGNKNYISIFLPNLYIGDQPENEGYWSKKPIKCIKTQGLTFCRIIYENSKINIRRNTYDYASREFNTFKIEDSDITLLNMKKWGNTQDRPNVNIGDITNLYGFQFFDRSINKPIWWNGTEWVDPAAEVVSWKIIR